MICLGFWQNSFVFQAGKMAINLNCDSDRTHRGSCLSNEDSGYYVHTDWSAEWETDRKIYWRLRCDYGSCNCSRRNLQEILYSASDRGRI